VSQAVFCEVKAKNGIDIQPSLNHHQETENKLKSSQMCIERASELNTHLKKIKGEEKISTKRR